MTLRAGPARLLSVWLGIGFFVAVAATDLRAQTPAPQPTTTATLSDAEIEAFLLKADIVKTKSTAKGITGSLQATLSDGRLTHDVHIQSIDESKREFQSMRGTEFNFRDSWTFNVAGYKLDRLLGLHMVPVSVSRRYRSKPSAFTWWVDDVAMDEGDRLKNKTAPPDSVSWNQQMQMVRLFDQLIYNVDRNMGNLLITNDWRVWAIDHTRAFRTHDQLKTPNNVSRCDRQVFQRLKDLNSDTLKRELGRYLDTWQIRALLARRDAIVQRIESLGSSALFDRTATGTYVP
jgi:hypothetical protein